MPPEKKIEPRKVVILTAIPIEYNSVLFHLSNVVEKRHPKGNIYEVGEFNSAKNNWSVLVDQIGAGNNNAAVEAERAISFFDPEVILFVGVAGGIKDVTLGDVVVSTKVYGYESGKAVGAIFNPRPNLGNSSYSLLRRAIADGRKPIWLQRIEKYRPLKTPPQVLSGPIAAGEVVVASEWSQIYKLLKKIYGDALAVEMEGRGVLQAAQANEQVKALVIRGISDLIENKEASDKGGSQIKAARHASAFAFEVLANYVNPSNTTPSSTSKTTKTTSSAQPKLQPPVSTRTRASTTKLTTIEKPNNSFQNVVELQSTALTQIGDILKVRSGGSAYFGTGRPKIEIIWVPVADEKATVDFLSFKNPDFIKKIVQLIQSSKLAQVDATQGFEKDIDTTKCVITPTNSLRGVETPFTLKIYRNGVISVDFTSLHRPSPEINGYSMINNYVEPQVIVLRLKEAWKFATSWWKYKKLSPATTPIFYNVGLFNLGLLNRFEDAPSISINGIVSQGKRNLPNPLLAFESPELVKQEMLIKVDALCKKAVDSLKFRYDHDY